MILMRLLCAVFVCAFAILAMVKVDVIVNLMVMSWGALAGVFLAPYIYGLNWKTNNQTGGYAGINLILLCAFSLFLLWAKTVSRSPGPLPCSADAGRSRCQPPHPTASADVD